MQCNGKSDPSDWLFTYTITGNHPDLVSYSDRILSTGCDRGSKSCHPPLNGFMRKLEAMLNKLDRQFKKYRQHALCGFGKGRGWAFAWADYRFGSQYEIDFEPAPEHELTQDNWNPNNWKDETTGVFDGCSAYQQLLDGKLTFSTYQHEGGHRYPQFNV